MHRVLITLLLVTVLCVVCNVQSQSTERKTPASSQPATRQVLRWQVGGVAQNQQFSLESIDDVLWWLPEDTETTSVARGPFKVTPAIDGPPRGVPALEYADLALRTSHLGILQTIDKGKFHAPLVGRSVLFCIQGSRRFRPPTQLGGMLYEGCDIIVLQDGLRASRDLLMRQLKSNARQVQSIAGQQVMVFEERLENDTWKLFVALPAPNVLLCATNRDYLTQVLNRRLQRGQKRALPEDIPEWKHVNTDAKFWAVRHYIRDDAQDDPSSPLSGEQEAVNWPDKQAIGIVFELDPRRSNLATVRYLSANKGALKLVTDYQAKVGPEFKPVIQQNGDGPIEMLVSLDESVEAGMLFFVLSWLFGHGIYL